MAVTVKQLYKNSILLYKMNLLAGEDGIHNLVSWVHIIEDQEVACFMRGEELVFCAGIQYDSPEWLLKFVQDLYEAGASALVVNIGPHIPTVSKEVLEFCNEKKFPLFSIPWETHMVDMTRDYCQRILKSEVREENVVSAFKNLIFHAGNQKEDMATLIRYEYEADSHYNFMLLSFRKERDAENENLWEQLKIEAQHCARMVNENYLSFSYQQLRVLLLVNYRKEEIVQLAQALLHKNGKEKRNIRIGVGANIAGIDQQAENFKHAEDALNLAILKKRDIVYYENLDVYKLVMGIEDKTILKDYYEGFIGPLERYDQENGSSLVKILQVYLENNASPQLVADKLFLHRNTVNNQLKKVEKLTGYNPLDLKDRMKFYLAYYVKDLL